MTSVLWSDVLDEYVGVGVGSPEQLREWIRRYPQFETELRDFTAAWVLTSAAEEDVLEASDHAKELNERDHLRGSSIVQNLLHHLDNQSAEPTSSLGAECQRLGRDLQSVAEEADLGVPLFRKLDRRQIVVESIPDRVLTILATILGRTVVFVRSCLGGPPRAAAALHHSDKAPELVKPQDFFEAIRLDPDMPEERRSRWMALKDQR